MPKFPHQRRRLISDLPFSAAQAAFRTPVSARLLSELLVPAFPAFPVSLSPASPYLLQGKTMVSMRCFTILAKAIPKKGGGGLYVGLYLAKSSSWDRSPVSA